MRTICPADCANINGGRNRSSHLFICPPLRPLSPHHPPPHSFLLTSTHLLFIQYATIYLPWASLPAHWSIQPLAYALAFPLHVCISAALYSLFALPPPHLPTSSPILHLPATLSPPHPLSVFPITIPPPTLPSSHPSTHPPHS